MIEGHTIDVFLADKYRMSGSVFYQFWYAMRGFTAPIFMFTAGVVFTYLLNKNGLPFNRNPRVKKGIKRFAALVLLGYLLRFPTINIFKLASLSESKWQNFFLVDALHLIGFGLLTIILLSYFVEKFGILPIPVFVFSSIILLVFSPVTTIITFNKFLPLPIAAYFNSQTGSFFPLFPWLGFVTSGAVLGLFIAKNKAILSELKFLKYLLIYAASIFFISVIIKNISPHLSVIINSEKPLEMAEFDLFRLSVVLFLTSAVFIISHLVKNIPAGILKFGRYSLTIYVVHLIILYGSVISLGINNVYSHQSSVAVSIIAAVIMIIAMGKISFWLDKFKLKGNLKLSYRLKLIFTELI